MTALEAVRIIGHCERIVASVHGVLSAEEAARYQAAVDFMEQRKARLQALRRVQS